MSDKAWKQEERRAAALFGGSRFPANSGGSLDFETARVVGQVKHMKQLSLAKLEALAVEIANMGVERGKMGVVVVKRRAGRGAATPRLVVMTELTLTRLLNSILLDECLSDGDRGSLGQLHATDESR